MLEWSREQKSYLWVIASAWTIITLLLATHTVLQEYLKAVDNLTINEENRLRIKVEELTKKKNEIETMELKHREEIRSDS